MRQLFKDRRLASPTKARPTRALVREMPRFLRLHWRPSVGRLSVMTKQPLHNSRMQPTVALAARSLRLLGRLRLMRAVARRSGRT
jgi:hypothetical protein